ncbi:MAG TPA: ATP-binding protein, partial [Patescibacteria group bacterium]|nr:ATP-binding protein [Patescibacteria group bacterium]
IVNLVGNAIKYTDEGGSITVGARKELEFVRVWVKDTGRGISEEDIPKLFKKFGRLDNSFVTAAERGGTGLGLYISKALVELHGGTIDIESKVKVGSTFSFTVPICIERRSENVE